jgi:hypothetical protein
MDSSDRLKILKAASEVFNPAKIRAELLGRLEANLEAGCRALERSESISEVEKSVDKATISLLLPVIALAMSEVLSENNAKIIDFLASFSLGPIQEK